MNTVNTQFSPQEVAPDDGCAQGPTDWWGFIGKECLLGDESAIAFARVLLAVMHTWDDLIDGDRQPSASEVHGAFRSALILLPGSAFYNAHFAHIYPLLDAALIDWLTANELEASGAVLDLQIAFIIRSSYVQILIRCAQIVGGWDHALKVAPAIRRAVHAEGMANYIEALRAEHRRA